jgi:predicted ATPase
VNRSNRLFVVSGCSGSGKSSLIDGLRSKGRTVVEEPGRRIVQEQLRRGGDALPWVNVQQFAQLCAEQSIRDFDAVAQYQSAVFFDRSFIDVVAAVTRLGLAMPSMLEEALASRAFARKMFMSPPWRDLFSTDEERRHSFDDAMLEYSSLVATYKSLGYEIVELPKVSVSERVSYVVLHAAHA